VRIAYVVGARPNIVKMAPVIRELRARLPEARHVLVHTGQHYDDAMSDVFLRDLNVPHPDHHLGVGSGSHAEQTARALERLEDVLERDRPSLVLVPGDVNSTLAGALVAAKLGIPLGHVESGLRSFDDSMPEEINRVVADRLSDFLFVHSEDGVENLGREGVPSERIHFVGNTMIDTLVALEERFRRRNAAADHGVEPGDYVLVTLHRPALTDDGQLLAEVLAALTEISSELPVLFPVHPRTRKAMGPASSDGVRFIDPLGYIDFLSLEADAAAVITDSGGIQEETTYLGVRCFTLRDNTERPVTVRMGTNTLLGLDPGAIREVPLLLANDGTMRGEIPPLWDGKAAGRVADVVARAFARGELRAA
jgi:UDP-N-acetylglucosamine 2-epimerase (non-hydrolysing)